MKSKVVANTGHFYVTKQYKIKAGCVCDFTLEDIETTLINK